jgi:hypothetical protein
VSYYPPPSDPYQPPIEPYRPPASPAPYGYLPQPVIFVQPVPTSGAATASLVLGIIGALGGWCMFGLPCALAVLFGHIGLSATRNGRRGGRGLAVAGLVIGYVFVVPWAIVFFTVFLGAAIGAGTPAPTITP